MLYFERISRSVCVHEQVAKRTWNVRFTVMCSCGSSIKESYFNNESAAETIQQRVMSELLPQERRAILQSNQISKAV